MDPISAAHDTYPMPLEYRPNDFTSLSCLFIQPGNTLWWDEHFCAADLQQVTEAGQLWVRWTIGRKTDAYIPWLSYRNRARVKPELYSVRVRNRSRLPASLSPYGVNEPEQWQTLRPGEERLVTMRGEPDWVLQNARLGETYVLDICDLILHYPQAADLTVTALHTPGNLVANHSASFVLAVEGNCAGRALYLEIGPEPWVWWRTALTASEMAELTQRGRCTVTRRVPWFLSPGEAVLRLAADGKRVAGVQTTINVINARRPGLPRTERRMHNGRPAFFVNGQPFTWGGYASYFNISPAAKQEFADSGACLFHVLCAPGRHYHNVSAPTWLHRECWSFGEVDQWASTVLQANPDARLIIRLALGMPPFWFDMHPDSEVRIQTQDGRTLTWQETSSQVATLCSAVWRREQGAALRRLIRYIASRPWASQVIGFNLGGGTTEEWFAWACNDNLVTEVTYFSDYSPDSHRAFARWCAREGLPWRSVPSVAARKRHGYELFGDDAQGRQAFAYNRFINEETARSLCYFARVVKQTTQGRSLTGAFFGYVVLLTGEARQSNSGQFGLRIALESPDVDYISGIPQHLLRQLTGAGYAGQSTAVESVLAHGKQYVDDNDLFSWLHEGHWHTTYGDPDPRYAAIEMHRRWMAAEAVRGNAFEWFSLSPAWHHDAALMREYALETRMLQYSLGLDRTPIEETALLIDDHSFASLTPTARAHYAHQLLLGALGRTGAPLGVWLLSDVDRLPDRIRFVAVVNAQAARDADLQRLYHLIRRGGRTVMVVGTPGLIDSRSGQWRPEYVCDLLGLPVRIEHEPGPARAALTSGGLVVAPIQDGSGVSENWSPRAYVEGDGWLQYADGRTAGVQRDLPQNGRLIWCGVPPFGNEPWLRTQLQEAGVHCYAPAPCSVHASREMMAVTSVYPDARAIELMWPHPVQIVDLFSRWRGAGQTIACPFERGQTRLFHVRYLS